jgi:hypothetical protein
MSKITSGVKRGCYLFFNITRIALEGLNLLAMGVAHKCSKSLLGLNLLMTPGTLIRLIPANTFQNLAVETNVDAHVKKLSGEVVFKLILFSMLNSEKLSLRVMESFLQSAQFKSFSHFDIIDGKYNSIRDRICTINADYFERLFDTVFSIYNKELKEEAALSKTDSTCVSIATKLLSGGIEMGSDNKKFVKYSVNLKGSIPSSVRVFTGQSYACEDNALGEFVDGNDNFKNDIVVFDRGIRSRAIFDKFNGEGKSFITRGDINIRCLDATDNPIESKPKGATVTLISDQTGYLCSKKQKRTTYKYRVIKGIIDKSGETICFITTIVDEDAYTIAQCYKKRWEIEVFFKFIKQHLNAKHLVSRDINGIKVMIYMTMILAILLIAYRKINQIKSFKIAKLRFELDLDNEITKEIVILCGGDPARAPHLFNSG